jgi:hypothetical protein
MTADIINLRRFRKQKERSERADAADANRRKHGRTGAEKKQSEAERERADRKLSAHHIERDED